VKGSILILFLSIFVNSAYATDSNRSELTAEEFQSISIACAQTGDFSDVLYVLSASDIILKENGTLEDATSYCCNIHAEAKRQSFNLCMEASMPSDTNFIN